MSLPDTNPAAYMTVKLRDNADTIYAFGKLGPLNTIAGNKVNIMITGPNGKDTVLADQRLQSDEGISIRYKAPGDYRVRFSPLTNKKWNFIVFYFFNQPPCTQCLPLEKQPAQLNDIAQDYYFNEKMFYTLPKQESFLKDSKNETGKRKGDSFKSINDLMNDSYDETLDDYVHSFKSYNIGDTITVSDKIAYLVYDVETNITSVGFDYLDKTNSNLTDKVYWDFAGDLRNRFSTGDNILLNVKVVPINQENHLETLDILGFQSEDVPFIDDFLVSNLQKN